MKQYFLIQVSETGSSSLLFEDRYENRNWKAHKKGSSHRDVNEGDILVVYFTGRAVIHPSQIRYMYGVKNISKDRCTFHVELYREIDPLSLTDIEELVDKKLLSHKFRFCGHQGFNITKISKSDYDLLYLRKIDESNVKEEPYNILTDEYTKLLEETSNINLLIFYQNNYDMMRSNIKRKLKKSGLIKQTKIDGKLRTVLTQKGVSLLKQDARQLEL